MNRREGERKREEMKQEIRGTVKRRKRIKGMNMKKTKEEEQTGIIRREGLDLKERDTRRKWSEEEQDEDIKLSM